MVGGVTSTFFSPDPSCAAASNLWLSTAPCWIEAAGASEEEDLTCTFAHHGERRKTYSAADDCFATYESDVAYTACPASYAYAGRHSSYAGPYYAVDTYCCPEAYHFAWETDSFVSSSGDTSAWVSLSDQPRCRASRVQALQSQIVTATAAAADNAEPTATTTARENNAPLFAEAEPVYYDGCPAGYSALATQSGAGYDTFRYDVGYFDISYYSPVCCPTEYPFTLAPLDFGRTSTTAHEGITYEINVYPMPGCYATSVEAQSGKQVPMQTWSNTMGWDKRDDGGGGQLPTTVSWDYEHGTVYAMAEGLGHTVFQGTHTCYDSCSTWLNYYYPKGTGGPWPSTTTTASESSLTSTSANVAQSTATLSDDPTQTGTGPTETGTGTAETAAGTSFKSNTAAVVVFWPGLLLAV